MKRKKDQITIVIVTYNSSQNVIKLLRSLEPSSNFISEVIIIENCSPEKNITKKGVMTFKKNSDIKLRYIVSGENLGFGSACNLGFSYTKSSKVLFLNPDCIVLKNSLQNLINHMDINNADILGGKTLKNSRESHRSVFRHPNLLVGLFEFSNLGKIMNIGAGHRYFYYEDILRVKENNDIIVGGVSGAYLLINSESFKKLKGFDENFFMYLEDVDLCVRASNKNMKIMYCPHSKIFHEGGASSKNKYRIKHDAWFESRKYYYNKHFGLFINMIIQPIFTIEERLLKVIKKI